MASLFREPATLTFVDADNTELAVTHDDTLVPRVGDNIRLRGVPFVVERVGYDLPADRIDHVWIVCRPA